MILQEGIIVRIALVDGHYNMFPFREALLVGYSYHRVNFRVHKGRRHHNAQLFTVIAAHIRRKHAIHISVF